MRSKGTRVAMPQDLIDQIDALVGPQGRSAFVIKTARTELAARATQARSKKMRDPNEDRLRRPHQGRKEDDSAS